MSLETIAVMVEQNSIDVQPEYQRRERWESDRQSALVESFLLNIPVPPVYLAEEDFGTYSVIDGKQRLTTIKKFMRNEFELRNLAKFSELEGLTFSMLPPDLANALKIRPYVRMVTLLKQSDPQLKYEVFTRLNTGGVSLKPQEIRNAMYRGPFNDLLVRLASGNAFLREQLKIRTMKEDVYLSMSDVEYVLRYFTMSESWKSFSGDYRRSMDKYMELNRRPSKAKLRALGDSFENAVERCRKLWGERAFRRYDSQAGVYRDQFLSALYDAQMIAVSLLTSAQFNKNLKRKSALAKATVQLFKDDEFDDAIRISTNSPSRVKIRVEKMLQILG
ncbi:hypothetical protein NB712_001101 [Xanthomonas sacchari]|nr:hypothetical protein [Xanthomonas sacchari]